VSLDPAKNLASAAAALALVQDDLALVEKRIDEVIGAREPKLTEISDYLINAGGKRIRPAVSLLVFRACGGKDVTDMVDLCVALELIHTATLLHDDIIDSNDVRRGKPAAPAQFGMADTLVTGDFLFSRAFQVCGRFEECIVSWAAEACVGLTEGEIMQGRYRRNTEATEELYLEIIRRKTASLFEAGARIASHLAGLSPQKTERMAAAGDEIGLAFQIIDDLLDIAGDAERTGKRVGTDLADGNPSLPIVWGLHLPAVRQAFLNEGADELLITAAIKELHEAKIPSRVHDLARDHARAAADLVGELEPSAYREGLLGLINDLVDRDL
jgi:octaprenyl-diphosphate synthase